VDLLDSMLRRNPELPRVAARLHRERVIPPDTYVLDLDAVRANARVLRTAFSRHGLEAYYEPKQFGRCPAVCEAIVEAGFEAAIALDIEEAAALDANGFRVGHIGHLGQPAAGDVDWVVRVAPEVVTVYSLERAAELGAAAVRAGRVQAILLRPLGAEDIARDLVGGGTPESELLDVAEAVDATPGLRLEGITSYPVVRYDLRERRWVVTPNMRTLERARAALEDRGLSLGQVNAAGNCCASSAELVASCGATHVEPGHAFVGSTTGHFFEDLEEVPALAWVSEVAYEVGENAYAFGHGLVANHTIGFWNAVMYDALLAVCGPDPETIADQRIWADPPEFVRSDPSSYMYLRLRPRLGPRPRVGDSVVLGVRTQIYRSNSGRLAVVDGISSGAPALVGLYDRTGREVQALDYPQTQRAEVGT